MNIKEITAYMDDVIMINVGSALAINEEITALHAQIDAKYVEAAQFLKEVDAFKDRIDTSYPDEFMTLNKIRLNGKNGHCDIRKRRTCRSVVHVVSHGE